MDILIGLFYVVTFLAILIAPIAAIGWIIFRLIKGSGGDNTSITGR
jgi:hypothetical protein